MAKVISFLVAKKVSRTGLSHLVPPESVDGRGLSMIGCLAPVIDLDTFLRGLSPGPAPNVVRAMRPALEDYSFSQLLSLVKTSNRELWKPYATYYQAIADEVRSRE